MKKDSATSYEMLMADMILNPIITKKDMRIAIYMAHGHDCTRGELLKAFYRSDRDPSGKSNRANLSRALKRLAPYIYVAYEPDGTSSTPRYYGLRDKTYPDIPADAPATAEQIPGQMNIHDFAV